MADLSQLLYGQQAAPVEAPEGVRVPWQGLPPARADQMRQRAYEDAQRKIAENAKVVQQGANVLQDMETFGGLNREARTGEFYTNILPGFAEGAPEQEMRAITSRLAPGQRIEGSGTTSDRDIQMFVQAVPSVDKKGSVNKSIRENFASQYEKSKAKLNFLQYYFDQYGHLNGVDVLWEKEKNNWLPKKPTASTGKNKLFETADAIINNGGM